MPEVILRTKDGWEKRMAVSDRDYRYGEVRVPVMSARDFALERDGEFDITRDSHFRYMMFRPSGEVVQIWEEW
jgi:hypothetical protein